MKAQTKNGSDQNISENDQSRAWLGSGNENGDTGTLSRNTKMKYLASG